MLSVQDSSAARQLVNPSETQTLTSFLIGSGDKEIKKEVNNENSLSNDRALIEAEHNKIINCAKKYGPEYELRELTDKFLKGSKCLICGFISQSPNFVKCGKNHMLSHVTSRPYKCDICSQSFSYARGLEKHKAVHTDVRAFKCNHCEKTFKYKRGWYQHMRTHKISHIHKTYSCVVCSEIFSSKGSLNRHLIKHTGELPYACDICDRKFARSESLKIHLADHSGENFKCGICGKDFTTNARLRMHVERHTERPKCECKLCPSKFLFQSSLDEHIHSMHSEEQIYLCANVINQGYLILPIT